MKLPIFLLLAVVAGFAFAEVPQSPIKIGPQWKEPNYRWIEYRSKDSWNYAGHHATLLITRTKCSSCRPIGLEGLTGPGDDWPNDAFALLQVGKYPAVLSLSVEPLHHHITSVELTTEKFFYRIQLTALNSVSARESMKLQQDVLRMLQDWQPE